MKFQNTREKESMLKKKKKKKPSGENKGTKCRGKGLQEYGISLQKHWKLEDSRVIPSRYWKKIIFNRECYNQTIM